MDNKKKILSIASIALIITAGAGLTAYAYQGDYTKKGPNCTPERHEEMTAALEKVDYEAWKGLMNNRGRVKDVITEENFAKFAEAHKLAQEGKYEEADAIREELGLRTKNGKRMGAHHGGGNRDGLNKMNRGKNLGGKFIDNNGDGVCDHLDLEQNEQ